MKKKLQRKTNDRWLAGVLSGMADYFGHDVLVWRIGFIFLLILTGAMPGLLLYIVAWVLMPEDTGSAQVEYKVVE